MPDPRAENTSDASALTERQQKALAALLAAPTVRLAAKQCRLSEATLYRMLADPRFSEAYKAARDTSLQQAMECLQSTAGEAVATLLALMKDTKKPASVRIFCSRTLLEYCFKSRELLHIEARLTALENQKEKPERG